MFFSEVAKPQGAAEPGGGGRVGGWVGPTTESNDCLRRNRTGPEIQTQMRRQKTIAGRGVRGHHPASVFEGALSDAGHREADGNACPLGTATKGASPLCRWPLCGDPQAEAVG